MTMPEPSRLSPTGVKRTYALIQYAADLHKAELERVVNVLGYWRATWKMTDKRSIGNN